MTAVRAILLIASLALCSCRPSDSPSTQHHLSIQGMHCEECVKSIHHSVIVIEGVRSCEVSLADNDATIMADDPAAIDRVLERIRLMGFVVEISPPA